MARPRLPTQADRTFGQDELQRLDRDEIRRLCHGLVAAAGFTVSDYAHSADRDDFTVSVPGLWRTDCNLIRVLYRDATEQDVRALEDAVTATGCLAGTLVCTRLHAEARNRGRIAVIPAQRFAEMVVRTSFVTWDEGQPHLSPRRLELVLELEAVSRTVDRVGIAWLPELAQNELPLALLADGEESPDVLLERKAFRIFTQTFRFGGARFGEDRRGERKPDAVITLPDRSGVSALLDCKAASSGYRMSADDMIRFERYWDEEAQRLQEDGTPLAYMVIVSSSFQGVDGDRHPYWGRAQELRERTNMQLVYLAAADLAAAAAHVETYDLTLERREGLPWEELFSQGLVSADDFANLLDGD